MNANIKPDFSLPTQIYLKKDISGEIAEIVSVFGKRIVLVTTSSDFRQFQPIIEKILSMVRSRGINCIIYDDLPGDPSTEEIDNAVSFIKKTNCDLIIGFGGIESINSAKAAALLSTNYVFCHNLLEGEKTPNPPLPHITIPAYPIFGFEISPMFFVTEIYGRTKRVFHSLSLYPAATIIDPVFSQSCSMETAVKSSICTLAIATESVISKENNDLANTFALKAIDFIFRNLIICYRDADNITSRGFVSSASVMSGIAFSSSFLSASMAIALALSSYSDIDLQSAMCVILPHIMEFNLTSSPGKYVQMSKVMGEEVRDITVIEAAIKTIEAIRKLETDLDIPQRLSNYDIPKNLIKEIANLAVQYPFLSNTPREITSNEVETILIAAY